jgi:acetylornithine deacetylase/succinyl-diaminopimelate desuccinylase-like protein
MQNLIREMAVRPPVIRLLNAWNTLAEELLNEALAIQAIPAPTFEEHVRAEYVRSRMNELGMQDIEQDEVGNVYARTPGSDPARPAVLVSAHLDTIFPAGSDLTTYHDQEGGKIYGPGLGDNSLGVTALIALAGQLRLYGIVPLADIWWVATVCEEGLGDLQGMRHAFMRLKERCGIAIILEGIGLGRIYNAGLGVRRLRIMVKGPGGHSWLHAERPSAIHHLLRLGSALVDEIRPPTDPRSSFNIGLIEGGTSINTRAPEASLSIDLRSVSAAVLATLETRINDITARFSRMPGLEVTTQVIGSRPSAALSPAHPLVRASQAILEHVGYPTPALETGSTDANIPLAGGMPAVCIGLTTGGNAHSTGEFIDTAPLPVGMRQLTLLTLLAAEHSVEWSRWEGSA